MARLFNSRTLHLTHLLVFLLLLGNIGCQKEMSKDTLGAGGTTGGGGGGSSSSGSAVFTLVPTGNSCSDAAIAGVIEAGTTLGADALITVTVNVTKTGDWTYSTATSDGFSFVGTGVFTATGSQVIILQGVGKPNRAGVFSFSLTIGGGACLVPVLVANAGTGGTGGNGGNNTSDFYYKATIDGTNYTQTITATTTDYEPGSGMSGFDDVIFGGGINWANPPVPAGKTEFGIDKGIMHHYLTATTADFKAFFAPGTYPYTSDFSAMDGIAVSWTDPSGNAGPNGTDNVWGTLYGTKDQTGSSFKILSSQEWIDIAGGYYMIVKAQFNCNLYNAKTGAKKVLTNGEAVVAFGF